VDIEKEIKDIKLKLAENNKMLHEMKVQAKWRLLGTILKWIIYLGIAFGSWYFIQPFVEQLIKTMQAVQGIKSQTEGIDFSAFLNLF